MKAPRVVLMEAKALGHEAIIHTSNCTLFVHFILQGIRMVQMIDLDRCQKFIKLMAVA